DLFQMHTRLKLALKLRRIEEPWTDRRRRRDAERTVTPAEQIPLHHAALTFVARGDLMDHLERLRPTLRDQRICSLRVFSLKRRKRRRSLRRVPATRHDKQQQRE